MSFCYPTDQSNRKTLWILLATSAILIAAASRVQAQTTPEEPGTISHLYYGATDITTIEGRTLDELMADVTMEVDATALEQDDDQTVDVLGTFATVVFDFPQEGHDVAIELTYELRCQHASDLPGGDGEREETAAGQMVEVFLYNFDTDEMESKMLVHYDELANGFEAIRLGFPFGDGPDLAYIENNQAIITLGFGYIVTLPWELNYVSAVSRVEPYTLVEDCLDLCTEELEYYLEQIDQVEEADRLANSMIIVESNGQAYLMSEVYTYLCSEAQDCLAVIDQDGDGVEDFADLCPDTPAGVLVDIDGCVLIEDSDADGVNDDVDLCPDTPVGEEADENGCSLSQLDSDNDGVSDAEDLCPDTPVDLPADEYGCAWTQRDSDGDGVVDSEDACPNTLPGTRVNARGCYAGNGGGGGVGGGGAIIDEEVSDGDDTGENSGIDDGGTSNGGSNDDDSAEEPTDDSEDQNGSGDQEEPAAEPEPQTEPTNSTSAWPASPREFSADEANEQENTMCGTMGSLPTGLLFAGLMLMSFKPRRRR